MAVAEPVLVGARFMRPERARRRSAFLALGASMMVCVLVTQCTVVMAPLTILRFSWMTFTTGARQLVVHDAAVTMWSFAGSYWPCMALSHGLCAASDAEWLGCVDPCGS